MNPIPPVLALFLALLLSLVALGIGMLVGSWLRQRADAQKIGAAQQRADMIRSEAEAEAQRITLEAKDAALAERNEAEAELNRRRRELSRLEERAQRRLEQLEQRSEALEERDRRLNKRQSQIDKRFSELEGVEAEYAATLERIAGMTREEAREELLRRTEKSARADMARIIRQVEAEIAEIGDRRAREVVTLAIERLASDIVAESTITSVPLPADDMKGRIIGRQGRNIRAIESVTGVDLVVDDTPEAIIISSHDPVRREVARRALTKLVQDGRIHPTRIEREVEKAQEEVDQAIREAGEEAGFQTGFQGLHPEILKLIGRLKFRTSYGQNQYYHAIETSHLAGLLATELHGDVRAAKMGGLLHDLGKAVSHEVEGPHALVGADIARRYGVPAKVVNIIAAHHGEAEPQSLEAILVASADAISGARPGARRESLENYIKRLTELEEIAQSFEGVQQAFAIQAGREVRIIVRPEHVDDFGAIQLSRNVAKKVEDSLQYPGQIRVTVIREMRATEYAK
ncbi:MAG: ribonuclease Y [Caldilineales bacterium]|nr:ribonuclease Y [Caldilineales bacterium]